MIGVEKFQSSTPMQKIRGIKSNPQKIKIDRSRISNFANPTKINKKKVLTIDKDNKIIVKRQLLRSMSARLN